MVKKTQQVPIPPTRARPTKAVGRPVTFVGGNGGSKSSENPVSPVTEPETKDADPQENDSLNENELSENPSIDQIGVIEDVDADEENLGFIPPPYPYDVIDELLALAGALPGGVVDCSIGTPCDDPPPAVVRALGVSGTERDYPRSVGSVGLRRSAADWIERRFNVSIDPTLVVACVGTKEFVTSTAHYLRLRNPRKDTIFYPAVSYPSYAMSAALSGARAVPVPPANEDGTGMDFQGLSDEDIERGLMAWVNSPSNPTGGLMDLTAAASWGKETGIPVFSDECYTEFTWSQAPQTILQSGIDGVIAVHSLSKRSNLAGLRIGFYAGDPDLVEYLGLVRKHAGNMVPGPIQAAAAVALADDNHVSAQRDRYYERLAYLAAQLTAWGAPAQIPDGSFYLWVKVPERFADSTAFAVELAEKAGLLVSPGNLYGPQGAGHVRIAVVQPMAKLQLAMERLFSSGSAQ